jgi:CRP-like cAMP-binding protein
VEASNPGLNAQGSVHMADHPSREASLRVMRRCPFFASLPPVALRRVLAKAHERRVMRRETVFRQGDRPDGLYMLTQGRMKLLLRSPGGRALVLAFVDPGEAFGYVAFMAGTPQTHAAQALVQSWVLAWKADVLEDVLRRYPAVSRSVLRLTARQIQHGWTRLHAFITEPVARRLARALLRLTRASRSGKSTRVLVAQQDLAELLGTTSPTLSRILGRWEARGLVAAGRERIVILHPEGLVQLAGWGDVSDPRGRGRSLARASRA